MSAHPLQFRKPGQQDWPVCRMLLPKSIEDGALRDYLLALESGVAGAVCYRDNGSSFEDLQMHVVKGRERKGVGAELLRQVWTEAKARGRREVTARTNPAAEPALDSFLEKHGFRVKRQFFTVEGAMRTAVEYLSAMQQRAAAGGRTAETVEIVPLSASVLSEAGHLYAEYLNELPQPAAAHFYFAGDIERYRLTQVLVAKGTVQGLALVSAEGQTATVHARIVRPEWRRGWSSAVLIGTAILRAHQAGFERLRFQFFDSTFDTLELSKRLNMETVECVKELALML
jgi:GNAT superfamily N-acetyltransferase